MGYLTKIDGVYSVIGSTDQVSNEINYVSTVVVIRLLIKRVHIL